MSDSSKQSTYTFSAFHGLDARWFHVQFQLTFWLMLRLSYYTSVSLSIIFSLTIFCLPAFCLLQSFVYHNDWAYCVKRYPNPLCRFCIWLILYEVLFYSLYLFMKYISICLFWFYQFVERGVEPRCRYSTITMMYKCLNR